MGAGVFRRWRRDVGNELDHAHDPRGMTMEAQLRIYETEFGGRWDALQFVRARAECVLLLFVSRRRQARVVPRVRGCGRAARCACGDRCEVRDARSRSGSRNDDLGDENGFTFFRGFRDLVQRERVKAEFYGGEYWLKELEKEAFSMIEDYSNVLLVTPV